MTDVKLPPLPRPGGNEHEGPVYSDDQMTEYARLAVLQERERCAKEAETLAEGHRKFKNWQAAMALQGLADAIRKGE